MTKTFDAHRYLGWLQRAVSKHYAVADVRAVDTFSVIDPFRCKVRTGSIGGERVAVPRTPRDMEQVADLAREQLIETLADGCGKLEFTPPTVDALWNDTDDEASTGEVIGHAFDIANDARVWEAVTDAAITFRRAAEHIGHHNIIDKYTNKTPLTVVEARALRDAREALGLNKKAA